jgi:N-terminal domain of anti-restriction factor ArdC
MAAYGSRGQRFLRKGPMMEQPTREQSRQRAAAKVTAAQEVLAAEVGALVTGADWQQFLDFQAQLYDYSANNVILIFAQHARAYAEGRVSEPTPTYVAGFETWRALGRSVDRGQHGYAVLAPMRSTRRQARDAEGNVRVLRRGDKPNLDETETRGPVLRGFTVATVFDASQTSGKNLPDPPRPRLLAGEAPRGLGAAVKELIESAGFVVDTVVDASHLQGANGQTNWSTQVVVVRADMDDAAMVKTLIHEAAHVLLHQPPAASHLPRSLKEVEAESVAYVVASVHGMPTDEYSFPYVAGWAGQDAAKAIQQTQARVNTAARAIIEASPAEHMSGAKPPGTETAMARERQLKGEVAEAGFDALEPGNEAVMTRSGGSDVA